MSVQPRLRTDRSYDIAFLSDEDEAIVNEIIVDIDSVETIIENGVKVYPWFESTKNFCFRITFGVMKILFLFFIAIMRHVIVNPLTRGVASIFLSVLVTVISIGILLLILYYFGEYFLLLFKWLLLRYPSNDELPNDSSVNATNSVDLTYYVELAGQWYSRLSNGTFVKVNRSDDM